MNVINRIILQNGEKKLAPFRLTEKVLAMSEFVAYQTYLPTIRGCYQQASYWHGTGRYQYAHAADSRYGNIDFTTCTDILELIVQENSLRPHDEPWLKKMQKVSLPTVSMTPFRMYARLYAGLYLYEKDALLYEFGTTKFWFRTLLAVQGLDGSFLWSLATKGLFRLASMSSYRNAQKWIRSIRNDKDKKPMSPFKGHLIHTDIADNYPIFIGIRNVKIIALSPIIRRLEARTTEQVLLKDMTHIEVPLRKVKETEDFLKERNISLQVIPFEFGEMYCSTYALSDLVGIKA